MAHSALFVAVEPATQRNSPEAWAYGEFLTRAQNKLEQAEGVARLATNVWLLNLQESVAAMGWLVSLAEDQKLVYSLLLFERAPEWLPRNRVPMASS